MAVPVIIRSHDGFYSYLVLDDNPRELLRHWGFQEEFSVRPWLGSLDPVEARDEWAEMLAEDPENFLIADDEHRGYLQECHFWLDIPMFPPRPT
jgi:hypothetical protein